MGSVLTSESQANIEHGSSHAAHRWLSTYRHRCLVPHWLAQGLARVAKTCLKLSSNCDRRSARDSRWRILKPFKAFCVKLNLSRAVSVTRCLFPPFLEYLNTDEFIRVHEVLSFSSLGVVFSWTTSGCSLHSA